MVNVWDYANSLPNVRLRTTDKSVYAGRVIYVWDAEETEDTEDSITLEMDSGGIKSFYPNEIESIEIIE